MRIKTFADKQFKFMAELLENSEVQQIGINKNEDLLIEIYEMFHVKPKIKVKKNDS